MTPRPSSPPDDPPNEGDLPAEVIELLEDQRPDQLRELARYAEDLAAHRERARQPDRNQPEQEPPVGQDDGRDDDQGDRRDDDQENETATGSAAKPDDRPANPPDDVPGKATLTVKKINDNRYYYWQWREGDTVTSRYEGPVAPDE